MNRPVALLALAAVAVAGWFYFQQRPPTTPAELLGVLDAEQITCNEFGREAQEVLGTAITLYDDHMCFEQAVFSTEASIERRLDEAGYTRLGPWELGMAAFQGHDQGVFVLNIGNGFGVVAVQGIE